MRAVWTAPGNDVLQGRSNVTLARMMTTLKRELQNQQDDLFINHSQEDVVDGGAAETTQFHYLLAPQINQNGANANATYAPFYKFDSNQGQTGTANYDIEQRRDFQKRRGF
jgi:hypothetical protein